MSGTSGTLDLLIFISSEGEALENRAKARVPIGNAVRDWIVKSGRNLLFFERFGGVFPVDGGDASGESGIDRTGRKGEHLVFGRIEAQCVRGLLVVSDRRQR